MHHSAIHQSNFDVNCICSETALIDLKLQQLKKFLKERKKLLKNKYLKKLVEKQNHDPIKSNQFKG